MSVVGCIGRERLHDDARAVPSIEVDTGSQREQHVLPVGQ